MQSTNPGAGQTPQARRAYSTAEWSAKFHESFAPLCARGPLLASSNDEPEPGDLTAAEVDALARSLGADK